MNYRVGRVTLAIALIAIGAVLVYDNLLGTTLRLSLFQLWPAVLILLGLEWIVLAGLGRRAEADHGAIALLITGAIVLGVFYTAWQTANTVRRGIGWLRAPVIEPLVSSEEFTQGFDLNTNPPATHLVVNGGPAAIIVQTGQKSQLELVTRAAGPSFEAAAANAQRARLNLAPGETTKATLELPMGVDFPTVVLRVTVPDSTRLTLESTSGSIEVVNRKGDLTASTLSGALTVDSVEGRVDLRSSSGAITVRQIKGSVSAISSSGAVRVERVSGDAEVSAASGSLSVIDVEGKLSAHTSSGSVTVETQLVGGDYELGAVSGSVRLLFPRSAGVRVDARSSSGRVSGPPWLILGEGRGSATGTQGDGGYKLTIRTTSGPIFLADR